MQVVLDRDPPPPLPVTLMLALPRPPMLRRILHTVTSMGGKRVMLCGARRVEPSFWDSRALAPEAIREQLVLGLEQACDTVLPEVRVCRRFKRCVLEELPAWAPAGRRIVAHPEAADDCPPGIDGPVTLAVGPEGGFNDFEIETLVAQGFEAVRLGSRVLRTEAAVPALLSRLL